MSVPGFVAYEAYRLAMDFYERAEKLRPPDVHSAIVRWNTCVRVIEKYRLEPHDDQDDEP